MIILIRFWLLVFVFFSVLSGSSYAQLKVVRGIVSDAVTLQPIPSTSIKLVGLATGTSCNEQGRFQLSVNGKFSNNKLLISSLNYITDTLPLSEGKVEYRIFLKPTNYLMDEIIVTGVNKATILRENPAPVVVVSSKEIEQTTENNIIDVLVKNVPGLNAVKTGPNISKPFIRGLGYNRVLTLFDGVRQEGQQWGDEHGLEVDDYNIERAEVIKGPASLMYGSDAVAGVVSLISAMPKDSDGKIHGRIYSEYQSNNGLIGNAARITFGKEGWAYAVRGSYRIAGNYTNAIDGKVYNTGFREANVSGTLKHSGLGGHSDLNFTLYDNLQGIPDGSRDSLTRKFTKQIYEGNQDDVKNRPIVPGDQLDSYKLSPLHQHIQHSRIYSNSHYQVGKGDVDFLLAFQQNIRREFDHPTNPKQAGLYVRLNTFNYGYRYNFPAIANTDISIGVNGMYQDNKNKNATDFPIPDYELFDGGSFIYAKWKKRKWTLTGGVRYDLRYLKGGNFYTETDTVTGFSKQLTGPDTIGAYLQFPAFSKVFEGFSYSLGTTYEISNNISLKANVARGYRAPNITEFASNGLDPGAHIIYLGNRNFNPEFSLQEDIGADFYFKNVTGSVSIFNNNIENYIYLSLLTDATGNPIVNAQGDKTYQYQQAAARLYGSEASLSFHPSFLQGFYFDNDFSIIYGFNKKPAFNNKGIEGEYLAFIPPAKFLSSLSRDVNLPSGFFSSLTVKAGMECYSAQKRFLALNNTETATPGYTIFNFSINGKTKFTGKKSLDLQFQVNNIFNRAYQSNLSRLKYFEYYTASPNGHLGIYNMGRNVCLKAIYIF